MVIIKYQDGSEKKYCATEPLMDQLHKARAVNISTVESEASTASDFLAAFCDLNKFYVLKPIELSVDHQNTIVGARLLRKVKMTRRAIACRWLVKELVQLHNSMDSRLNDIISNMRKKSNA